ncbi:MAG: hypothetical protein ACRBG0_16650 [Lewinella sp.]|uniref:hypothetical protein n=1 Tax=Lewinella sp. TaxID=2004506 RepID=UPI003D6C149B
MNKYLLIGFGFMLLACNSLFGQTKEAIEQPILLLQEKIESTTPLSSFIKIFPVGLPSSSDVSTAPSYLSPLTLSSSSLALEQQPNCYSAADLAFFCRLEVKLEQATKMPVRFRLGDVQQVDYLEGKFTGWRYGY